MTNRELDAAVAKAIGRKVEWVAGGDDLPEFTADREWLDEDWMDVAENKAVARYSESMDAALRAYEEFRGQRGERWRLFKLTHCPNGQWRLALLRSAEYGVANAQLLEVYAETPARALCLALLEAAGRNS